MKSSSIKVSIQSNSFSPDVLESMWSVYHPHYHYSHEEFLARIPKNNYYSLYYRAEKLVGFTGLRIEKVNQDGKKFFTVYFGQTVIDPSVRSKGLIPRTGIQLCRMFWKEFLTNQVYFWADALTYKAYLVFAKTLEEYYPCRRRIIPLEVRELRNYLGNKYYGQRYCSNSGTVTKDSYLISDQNIRFTPSRSLDPDVSYFQKANPMHESGAGLITIAPIHMSNIWMIIQKVVQKIGWFNKFRRINRPFKYRRLAWTRYLNSSIRNAG